VIIRGLASAAGVDVPRLQDAALNGSVLVFSAGVCAMVALLLSAVPAMTPQLNVERQLRATTGSIASAAPVRRWHNALVVFELACALIPLTGAGLMLRSLGRVQSEGAIVKPQQVLLGRIQPGPQGSGGSDGDRLQESDRVLREIEATAGIRSAALWSATFGLPAKVAGLPTRDKPPVAMWFSVSPEFREAAGLQLVAGRWLSSADRRASVPVVVVSERFAREFAAYLPSIPSLVGRATIGPFPPPNSSKREAPMTIVGIVSDFRSGRLGILQPDAVNPLPQVFYPDALRPMVGGELIVRVNDNPVAFIDPVRRVVQTRPGARLVAVRSLEDQLALATAPRRFNTRLFVAFAVLAALLAAIGVAGVFRHAVAQRRQEIGLRLAVGATRLDVLRMIMSHAATLAILGVVVGAGGAAIVSRSLEHILYGVDAYDPRAYLTMSAALVAVALVAAYLPARRAMGLEPVMVLRHE
jgi:predicted permease